jgi:hypothetical protein
MRPLILLIGVLLLSVRPALAWNVTNSYSTQGGGNKDCGAPPPGVWTQIIADNAGYPCYAMPGSNPPIFLCEPGGANDLDYWSYIVHGNVTFDTQIELRAASDPAAGVGTGTSITLSMPTSVNGIYEQYQPNDVLVTQLAAYTSGAPLSAPTPPEGSMWTQITSKGTSTEQEWLFYHIAGSQEPSEYTWTFDTPVVAAAGGIADYANVNTSDPIGSVGAAFNLQSTTMTCPAISLSVNQEYSCSMATFADSIYPYCWQTSPNFTFPGLFLGVRWLFEYPPPSPIPSCPPGYTNDMYGLVDAVFIDQPVRNAGSGSILNATMTTAADNAVISAALNPITGPRTVSSVEVRTYVGPQGEGNCTGGGTSTVTCPAGYKLLEDSTYAMPASNSINVPFDAPEFDLASYASTPGDGNYQAFYVFAMPTGGSVSCGVSYLTHESN